MNKTYVLYENDEETEIWELNESYTEERLLYNSTYDLPYINKWLRFPDPFSQDPVTSYIKRCKDLWDNISIITKDELFIHML